MPMSFFKGISLRVELKSSNQKHVLPKATAADNIGGVDMQSCSRQQQQQRDNIVGVGRLSPQPSHSWIVTKLPTMVVVGWWW